MKNYGKMTGPELAAEYEELGINARWIKGRGMIYMSAYYGMCAVQGDYRLYSRQTAADALGMIERMIREGMTPAEVWADLRSSDWLERTQPSRGLYRVR